MNSINFIIKTVLDATGLNQFIKKMKLVTKAQTGLEKTLKRTAVGTRAYGKTIRKGNLLLRTTTKLTYDAEKGFLRLTSVQKKTTKGWRTLSGTTKTTGASFNTFSKGLSKTTAGLIGAAKRALVVIPVWLALRGAMMSLVTSIRLGITHIVDFDKALARAEAVARPTTESIGEFMDTLKVKVRALALETGVSVDKITELFYRMGTAGLTAEEGIGGMEIALKTSVAIMGDATETAKLLADIYNLMGDSMVGVKTPIEKMQKIGATMAILWKDNAFTLDEFTGALKTFVPTAKAFNLTLDEMLGLTASAATLMSRGATAGTQMSRAFLQLGNNLTIVEGILGKTINIDTANSFNLLLQVLVKLNTELKGGQNIATKVKDIFGVKGSKTILSFAGNIQKVLDNLSKLSGTDLTDRIAELEKLFALQNDTLQVQINRFQEVRKQAFEAFATGVTGTDNMLDGLKRINSFMAERVIPVMHLLGEIMASIGKDKSLGRNLEGILDAVTKARTGFETLDDFRRARKGAGPAEQASFDAIGNIPFVPKAIENVLQAVSFTGLFREAVADSDTIQEIKIQAQKIADILADTSIHVGEKVKQMKEELGEAFSEEQLVNFMSSIDRTAFRLGKMQGLFKDINEEVDKADKDGGKEKGGKDLLTVEGGLLETTKARLILAGSLQAAGFSELEIAIRRLQISESQKKSGAERLKLLSLIVKEVNKEAQLLKDTIQGSIKDALMGEGDAGDIFASIGERIKDSITDALATNITEEIFKSTGIGTIFGEFMFGLKSGADLMKDKEIEGHTIGAEVIYNRIIQAHIDGAAQITTDAPGGIGGAVGAGGLLGGLFSKQLIKPTISSKEAVMTGLDGTPLDIEGRPTTAKFGVLSGGGLTVGGAVGAVGGAMALADLYKLKGSGDAVGGIFQGAAAGAAVGAIAGPIGMAVGAAVGAAIGLFQSTRSKSTEEISQTTKEIAAKIKITNNQLQVVNRNLVALRQEITFILPDSAYFSESTNLSDQFSIDSRR